MPKKDMNALLKRRMSATQQASELEASDQAYESIIQQPPPASVHTQGSLPIEKLTPFFTADIGFKPYPPEKLAALAEQLQEDGLLVRVIVRKIPNSDRYEILSGHNRINAAKQAGWTEIPAEIVEADDVRAVVIATSTNLIQRQSLTIIERGKAYRALLEAKRKQGYRTDILGEPASGEIRQRFDSGEGCATLGEIRQRSAAEDDASASGEIRQRYSARTLVADFFDVSVHEVRKAVKLTYLIPELQDILEQHSKQLLLSCAVLMADYDAETQHTFIKMCTTEGYRLNIAAMKHIARKCPPPSANASDILAAWQETLDGSDKHPSASSRKITLDSKKFAPYLEKLGGIDLETLFLEFLKQRTT